MGEWIYPPHLHEIHRRDPVAHEVLCWLLSTATGGVAGYTVTQLMTVCRANRSSAQRAIVELVEAGEIELSNTRRGSTAKILKPERYGMPLRADDIIEKPIGNTEYSRLVADTKTVLRYYRKHVRSGDNLHESKPPVQALLEKGYTREDLIFAIDEYLADCKSRYVQRDRFRGAASFFLPEIVDSWLPPMGTTTPEDEMEEEKNEETGPVRSKLREAFARKRDR